MKQSEVENDTDASTRLRLPVKLLFGVVIPCSGQALLSCLLYAGTYEKFSGSARLEVLTVATVVLTAFFVGCLIINLIITFFPWRSHRRLLLFCSIVAIVTLIPGILGYLF